MGYLSLRLQETVKEIMYNFGPEILELCSKTIFIVFCVTWR